MPKVSSYATNSKLISGDSSLENSKEDSSLMQEKFIKMLAEKQVITVREKKKKNSEFGELVTVRGVESRQENYHRAKSSLHA
jgi:hypothetical protein